MSAQCLIAEFLSALTEKRFIDAKSILENPNHGQYIHDFSNFRDGNDDTLMHHTIHAFLEEINKIWKDADSLQSPPYTKGELNLYKGVRRQAINRLTEDCISLIDKMIEHKFICDGMNKQNKTPFYLFIDILEGKQSLYDAIAAAQAKITEKLEQGAQRLFSGKRYVADFKLISRSKKDPNRFYNIPDTSSDHDNDGTKLTLHERQALYGSLLTHLEPSPPNLVLANIGFIISDIRKPNLLENDLNFQHTHDFFTFPIVDPLIAIFGKIEGAKRPHSESGLCAYLHNRENLIEIIKQLKKKLKDSNHEKYDHKIHGIVLDIHSSLVVCAGCCSELQTLQIESSRKNSFIAILKEILEDKDNSLGIKFTIPKKHLRVVIRASGIEPSNGDTPKIGFDPSAIIHEEYSRDIKKHAPGVILHLVPQIMPAVDRNIYSEQDLQKLEEKITRIIDIRQRTAKDKLANLSQTDAITQYRFFYGATAFSSTGGNNYQHSFKDLGDKLKMESIDEDRKLKIFEYSLKM